MFWLNDILVSTTIQRDGSYQIKAKILTHDILRFLLHTNSKINSLREKTPFLNSTFPECHSKGSPLMCNFIAQSKRKIYIGKVRAEKMLLSVLDNIISICYYSLLIFEFYHTFQEHYEIRRQSAVFVSIRRQFNL